MNGMPAKGENMPSRSQKGRASKGRHTAEIGEMNHEDKSPPDPA